MTLGDLGFALIDLMLVSAMLTAVGLLAGAFSKDERNRRQWRRIGKVSWWLHALSTFGTVGLLMGMIFARDYGYHYVYSHAANELPNHYLAAAFWEGQEGSFLLWMFWHAVLGSLLLLTAPKAWRAPVVGIIATVQVILSSMVLGVFIQSGVVYAVFAVAAVVALGFAWRDRPLEKGFIYAKRNHFVFGILAIVLGLTILITSQDGRLLFEWESWPGALTTVFLGVFLVQLLHSFRNNHLDIRAQLPYYGLWSLLLIIAAADITGWKVGSSPFLTIHQAFPDDPTLVGNPDFVPNNGSGLNPLLQNYWMVIHPPTLFLGFASMTVPFAFVVAGLLRRQYGAWVKPAMPWTLLANLVLGVGIIMGGYWAYETLNFGGYWNWDPVENASLVPWIVSVGALHTMLAWQKGKTNLRTSMLLVVTAFVLVLYSTFLTRSGILGNASVHSFTDLGLSGQLLVLLFVYLGGVTLLFFSVWHLLPQSKPQKQLLTRQNFLYAAAITLTASAALIITLTSMPVFNAVFGTNVAPPAEVPRYYYQWTIWFGILIALLSGVGQYFFWTKVEKQALSKALFRPFMAAVLATIVVLLALWYYGWEFAFNDYFREKIELAKASGSTFDYVYYQIGMAIMFVADELLLVTGVFTVFANLDILIRLTAKNLKHLKRIGGSLAHIGIALILIGVLFSAGYETTISTTGIDQPLSANLPEDEKKDHVQLVLNRPVDIKNYRVMYRGRNYPREPIGDVKVIHQELGFIQVGFRDAQGDRYQLEPLPAMAFGVPGQDIEPMENGKLPEIEIDQERLSKFVEQEYAYFEPELMNSRTIFRVDFIPRGDSGQLKFKRAFSVFPETELDPNENIISHPDRKIKPQEDVYVHVSGVMEDEDYRLAQSGVAVDVGAQTMETPQGERMVADTVVIGNNVKLVVDSVVEVTDIPQYQDYDLVARAYVKVMHYDQEYFARPTLMLDGNRLIPVDADIKPLAMRLRFARVDVENDKILLDLYSRGESILINAIRKPYINILWLGTFFLAGGFILAIFRRISERTA